MLQLWQFSGDMQDPWEYFHCIPNFVDTCSCWLHAPVGFVCPAQMAFFYNFIKYSLQYVEQNWKHALTSFNKCIYQMFIWYNFVLFSMYALNDMWRFWYHNFCFIRMKLYEQYDKRGERNNKSFVHDNKPYKRYKM